MGNSLSNNLHVIAGTSAGNKVCANTSVFVVYKNMLSLAKQGNHWARVSVAHLHSLASGHFKNSVFVHPNSAFDKLPNFTMILPGCKAQVLKRSSGEYLVYKLEVDARYQDLQESRKKPGLFRATPKGRGDWNVDFVSNGQVKGEKNRIVTVSDQYKDLNTAVGMAANAASEAPIGGGHYVDNNGFDVHFTPGNRKIGGLTQLNQARNPDTDPNLHESALLLARSMAEARKTQGVSWISEGGGSGVLTQAMCILKDQGLTFKDTGHHVFFCGMTTRLVKAQSLASEIGMKFDRKIYNVNHLNLNQWVGGLGFGGAQLAAYYRFQQNPEHTALKLGADLANQTIAIKGAANTVGITTAVVSTALGVTITGGSLGACIAFASAVGAVAGGSTKLLEAWLPRVYYKIKRKF